MRKNSARIRTTKLSHTVNADTNKRAVVEPRVSDNFISVTLQGRCIYVSISKQPSLNIILFCRGLNVNQLSKAMLLIEHLGTISNHDVFDKIYIFVTQIVFILCNFTPFGQGRDDFIARMCNLLIAFNTFEHE